MTRFTIIGTSHIARQSIEDIKESIEKDPPNIIAVELDQKRLHALIQNQKSKVHLRDILSIGIKGYLFVLIGSYIQRKLGKMVGMAPGADMLQGIKWAKTKRIPLALIDQDIEITLRRFSKELTWTERFRFGADLIRGTIFPKKELKRYGIEQFDLQTVPSEKIIRKLIAQLQKRYPNIYKVLIDERNSHMIRALSALSQQHPDNHILVIIGAGHKEAIQRAIDRFRPNQQIQRSI